MKELKKKKINSRTKGKVAELALAHMLQEAGYEARRGQQFKGTKDSPDVICHDLPIQWESKAVQSLNLHKAVNNLKEECATGKWRVVAWKKNHQGWLACLPMEDFLDIIKEWKERSNG